MSQRKLSRRDLLKMLAAATGATALSTVPNKWVTPIVEIGALPAHAQALQRGSISVGITNGEVQPIKSGKPNAQDLTDRLDRNHPERFDHNRANQCI